MTSFKYTQLFILIYFTFFETTSAILTCKATVSDDFTDCTNPFRKSSSFNKEIEDEKSRTRWYQGFCRIKNTVAGLPGKDRCKNKPQSSICFKSYNAIVVDMMPYTYQMTRTIQNMMRDCCRGCADVCPTEILTYMSKINATNIAHKDIVFPIIAKESRQRLHGFYFLPISQVPKAYLITMKLSKKVMTDRLVTSCSNLWPLLTICLLMACISGFIAWLVETPFNEGEFPRPFRIGLFEGFWWSFISMTTVGYGDKAPKTLAGRLFAVAWILVGITVCSMFTASLTTEITKTMNPAPPRMNGLRIGALKHRLHDAIIISKNGGLLLEVEHTSVKDGVDQLLHFLTNKTISGFVVDIQTFHYYKTLDAEDSDEERKKRVPFHPSDLIKTEQELVGETLSLGALFKSETTMKYFQDYFVQNQLQLDTCENLKMNEKMSDLEEEEYILNPHGGLFFLLVYCLVGVIVFILVVGFIYEYWRTQKEVKTRPESEG